MIVEKKFKHGLTVGAKNLRDFSVSPQTLRGELAALEYIEMIEPQKSVTEQELLESLAYIAQQLTIDGADVTPELLLDLTSDDYKCIIDALAELEKK